MQINQPPITRTCNEAEIYNTLFDFTGKRILELGCGAAALTRLIAEANPSCHIDALEVDTIQHAKNLQITDLPNVTFKAGGAEAIPAEDQRYDIVFMFKSLHHVPLDKMDTAMQELKRVLKPGGKAYLSEPIYAGDFNEMMSIFHDEKIVREHAFAAIQRAVNNGLFTLQDEIFFNAERKFDSFKQFEARIIGVTFVEHKLDAATLQRIKAKYDQRANPDGSARYETPMRVDVLVK